MKQYIDKSAVVAEIIKIYDRNRSNGYIDICDEMDYILSYLDTLEVKDVDLEREIESLDSLLYDDRNREYTINRLSPYMADRETTEDLRRCCERCEQYCGSEHNYEECRCPILELWYEVKFWRSLNY